MKSKKVALLILTLVILAAAGGGYYLLSKDEAELTSTAETTSDLPSAQSDFTSGQSKEDKTDTTSRKNQGSATVNDKNGQVSNSPSPNQWTTSETGEITTYSPTANQLIKSSDELSGKSSLDYVYYRIIDNISGVITSGRLKVVGGKFAGTMQFSTEATEGRIDVFGQHDDGREFSNINIPVKFD